MGKNLRSEIISAINKNAIILQYPLTCLKRPTGFLPHTTRTILYLVDKYNDTHNFKNVFDNVQNTRRCRVAKDCYVSSKPFL